MFLVFFSEIYNIPNIYTLVAYLDSMESIKRRRFLAATVVGATGGLTGCLDGDGDENGDQNETEDGAEDGENGDDEAPGGTDGEDTETDGGDGDTDGESVSFGGVYRIDPVEEFAFESEVKDGGSTATGRHYQGDTYVQFETEQGTGEYYKVGDDQYIVSEEMGMCIENPGSDMTPSEEESEVDTGEYESDVQEYSTLSPTGTTTIDGEQVYIFELTPEMTGHQETTTYYVGVNSGYLRRVETSRRVVDLHSWGEVKPVETPDMDCQDMSDMPMSPGGF